MKVTNSKTLVTFAGLALVVPFVAVSALVGARAVASAGGAGQNLLLLALALVAAVYAATSGREGRDAARESCALHITARGRR
jgi:hypothetical protein